MEKVVLNCVIDFGENNASHLECKKKKCCKKYQRKGKFCGSCPKK